MELIVRKYTRSAYRGSSTAFGSIKSPPPPSDSVARSGKASRKEAQLISVLQSLDNTGMRTEVAKRKIERMESANAYRREKIAIEKQKESREAEKDSREAERFYIEQFDSISRRIKELQREYASETMELIRESINDQITLFQKKLYAIRGKMLVAVGRESLSFVKELMMFGQPWISFVSLVVAT